MKRHFLEFRQAARFLSVVLLAFLVGVSSGVPAKSQELEASAFPKWSYDAGPDPRTPLGKELIDLTARIPYFPGLSVALLGSQKFRLNFGPIPWRMLQKPNSVKILFIGQDGTHIAEAAGRPATAGFGGRAQDLAEYFGVSSGAAFINAYTFTIYGQAMGHNTPYIEDAQSANPSVGFTSFVDNNLWLMSYDQQSSLTQWRNELISWIIRNNRDSLRLVVLFGGAAQNAMGAFIESKGGRVGTRYSAEELKTVRVPEVKSEGTGGNGEIYVPLTRDGRDLYREVLGTAPNYKDSTGKSLSQAQSAFRAAFEQDPQKWMSRIAFSKGLNGSGVVHPAQLGGYNVDSQTYINGKRTISLKGLKIAEDYTVQNDVLVVELPHPTYLTNIAMDPKTKEITPEGLKKAAQAVASGLGNVAWYAKNGWSITADQGLVNQYAQGKPYRYGRADMGPEFYDFGAPASRMVNVSTAVRLSSDTLVFGTRDRAYFDPQRVEAMKRATPARMPDAKEMWITRSRLGNARYVFDAGPGEYFARIMKENIPADVIANRKSDRDYGHYRGTFVNPRVLVLADPDGHDDLITARALTGTRGQYLHGLMEDLGVQDQYLVIKTAPFGMESDWNEVFNRTKGYRDAVLKAVAEKTKPELILADGEFAAAEIKRIFPGISIPVVEIARTKTSWGAGPSGLKEAAAKIAQLPAFAGKAVQLKMADIPRSHLSYYARIWEGTSGDRVLMSSDPAYEGKAFAMIVPRWAYRQKYQYAPFELESIQTLRGKVDQLGLRRGGEDVADYLARTGQ